MTRYRVSAVAPALFCATVVAVLSATAWNLLGTALASGEALTATWTAKSPAPKRWWSAATFMPQTCELLAYGGGIVDSSGRYSTSSDTLLYSPDTDTWAPPLRSTAGGPPPLVHHALSWDTDNGVAVMFGGIFGGPTNLTFGFAPHTRAWTKLINEKRCTSTTCPSPRSMHAQAWSSTLGATLVFGGRTGKDSEVTNDLWMLRAVTGKLGTVTWRWTLLNPGNDPAHPAPPARSRHGMAEIPFGPYAGKMLIYGGWNAKMVALSDTWLYDPKTNSYQLLESAGAPTPRQGFGMAFSPTLNNVVIQGGQTNSASGAQNFTPETWAFDRYSAVWVLVDTNKALPGEVEPPPQGRSYHDLVSNTCGAGSVILYDTPGPNGAPPTQQSTWVLKSK